MAKADYIGLPTEALLKKAFADWNYMGFTFPLEAKQNDGVTGTKCISTGVKQFLRRRAPNGSWQAFSDDVVGLLSGHIYFTSESGTITEKHNTFKVKVLKFHMTVRRSKSQDGIDKLGPSILTSKESIHIGLSSDKGWGRPDNLRGLVTALANDLPGQDPFKEEHLLDFLNNRLGWNKDRMRMLALGLCEDAAKHLTARMGVNVTVEGDASTKA